MSALGRGVVLLAGLLLLNGCFFGAKKKSFDYGPFVSSDPRSVVVAPVAGAGPLAQDLLLASIAKPLAERGYYVMPVRMTQTLAAEEGFTAHERETTAWLDMDNNYRGHKVVENAEDDTRLAEMAVELAEYFGADSVLFVQIVDWSAEVNYSEGYFANWFDEKMDHSVGANFRLADARGRTIWEAKKHIVYRRGGGNIFKEMWNASRKPSNAQISWGLAREINWWLVTGDRLRTPKLWYSYHDPMLVGPYHPSYQSDRARRGGAK